VHTEKCPQCKGSSGPGDPWRDGHYHGAALRKVCKEVLRDLWLAARASHGGYDAAESQLGRPTVNGNPLSGAASVRPAQENAGAPASSG